MLFMWNVLFHFIFCSFVGKTNISNSSWDYKLLQRFRIAAIGRHFSKEFNVICIKFMFCLIFISFSFNVVVLFVASNKASSPNCDLRTVQIRLDFIIWCMIKMSKYWLHVWIKSITLDFFVSFRWLLQQLPTSSWPWTLKKPTQEIRNNQKILFGIIQILSTHLGRR